MTWMVRRHLSNVKDREGASKCLVGTFVHKLTPSADTQASGLILQTVSPPAPWVLITSITHLSLSVLQTMSCPFQDIGDDRSINWSVIKPGLSYTASQMPTCMLGQLWVHEGFSRLIVITHTWRSRGCLMGPATAGMLMTSCYLLNHCSFQGSGCSGQQSYELMSKYSPVTSYPKNGSNVISMYTWF